MTPSILPAKSESLNQCEIKKTRWEGRDGITLHVFPATDVGN